MSLRTSLFSIEVEFGTVNGKNKYNITVPAEWTDGCKNALFIRNANDGSLKVIPTEFSEVAMIRIKTKNLKSLQEALQQMIFDFKLKCLHTTGVCKDVSDCYTEIIVKRDKKFIDNVMELKKKKDQLLVDELLVVFLNDKYQRFEELVKKTGSGELVKDFLSLRMKKDEFIRSIGDMAVGEKTPLFREMAIHVSSNFL
jgi:hypothetical protein